jgi:hypothetical protein
MKESNLSLVILGTANFEFKNKINIFLQQKAPILDQL